MKITRYSAVLPFLVFSCCAQFLFGDTAAKIKADIEKHALWQDKPFACYSVPAISNQKRLPNRIPSDAQLADEVRVVGAQGEFVPVSFMVFPMNDIGQAQLKISELRKEDATIPSENVDARIVKCWYQGGTAWHSYFADPDRRTLIPELLLHDETLINVDHEKEENYLRVDYPEGSEYLWISYPGAIKGEINVFNHAVEPVADAATLQPFELVQHEGKQFWLTIEIPQTAAPGCYSGTVAISTSGQELGTIRLSLAVLPFPLPEPKTYYDLEEDFFTLLYNHSQIKIHLELLGEDIAAAERKVLSELHNMRDHNVTSLLLHRAGLKGPYDLFARQFELMQQAGMRTDPIFGFLTVYNWELLYRYLVQGDSIPPAKWQQFEKATDAQIALVRKILNHENIYGVGWDEPGRSVLEAQYELFRLLHDKGIKIYSTGKDTHFNYSGFNEDIVNYPGHPFKAEAARKWHAMGTKIFSYAGPHTGPENPDFIRRKHGLQLYKADYDGSGNYRYYGYRHNPWNDFENDNYRICFVYPTRDGIVDTLHWEGFREAIDDIRYATKLQQVANQAIAAGGAERRYAGKKALQYLATLNENTTDLNAARLEMIHHILKIQKLL